MVLLPASSFARLLIPRSKLIGPATLGLIGIVTKHPKDHIRSDIRHS
jgi:hypothetical protein